MASQSQVVNRDMLLEENLFVGIAGSRNKWLKTV